MAKWRGFRDRGVRARVRTDPGYTRRTYKARWGLGVTTRFDNPVRDTGMGPNLQIWRNLPKVDQDAYARTLWGEADTKFDYVFAFDEEDFSETGGCTRKAVSRVFTPAQTKGTCVDPKDVLVENDPRIIEAEDNWTECMRTKGYDYKGDQNEIIEECEERLDKLLGGDDPTSLAGHRKTQLRNFSAAGDRGLDR